MIPILLQYLCALIVPLFFLGLTNRVKAVWAGRKGAPLVQPYYDIFRLLRKGEVVSTHTSFIFQIAPAISVAAGVTSFLFLPFASGESIFSFDGDIFFLLYVFGIARFMLILSALDTGSSFEGMGASREATFALFVEVGFVLLMGTLVLATGEYSLARILTAFRAHGEITSIVRILFVVALFLMVLAEGSRVPVDDPNTHLELTMIHEVMILDNAGPGLAFYQYAIALKMFFFAFLIAHLCIPFSLSSVVGILLFVLVIGCVFVGVGIVESVIARARLSHVPQFLFLIAALSSIAFALLAISLRGGIL